MAHVYGVHRIVIVTRVIHGDDVTYGGYLLSSKINKSNKYDKRKGSNNIYINDYSTILKNGTEHHKEAFIDVKNLHTFDKTIFSKSGTYKGTVTDEFLNFIIKCANNCKNKISNKNIYWEK